jgi:hypothetical protein
LGSECVMVSLGSVEGGLTSIHLVHPVMLHSRNPARLRIDHRNIFIVMIAVSSEKE